MSTHPQPADTRSATTASRVPTRFVWPLVAVGLALGLLAAWLVPLTSLGQLRGENGDPTLAARARAALGDPRGFDSVDVAEVRGGRVTTATLGPQRGRFEPGSITKTFTAHLFADAVARGEVAYADPLEKHLPELRGTPAGNVTLEALATQRSGLPREPLSRLPSVLKHNVALNDPFDGYTRDRLVTEARTMTLTKPGEYAYSNVGASLLGHALAAAARQPDWASLARVRLFEPLGMTATTIATTDAEVPGDAAQGRSTNGLPADPWTSPGDAPAGASSWTTAADMGKFAQAILEGRAPGMEALDPRAPAGKQRIGLFWMNRETDGRRLVWHNGSTGGSASMMVLDPAAKSAVVMLGTSRRGPESGANALLTGKPNTDRPDVPWVGYALVVASVLMAAQLIGRLLRPRSRTRWIEPALSAAGVLLVTWRLGPWDTIPSAVVGALAGVLVGGVVAGILQSPRLPWTGPGRVRAWLAVTTSALVVALVLALVVG
ncbi:serine hydrolase domain-containing protein [Mariniluteicoccus flavus]